MAGTEHQRRRLESETNPKRLMERLDQARTERLRMEPLLEECTRLYLPGRRQFYRRDTGGDDNAGEIYDETGVNALSEYASRIHAGMTPNFTKFAIYKAGPDVQDSDRAAVDRDLEEITDWAFEEITASNFSQEANEAYLDMGISTGSLLVEEGKRDLLHHTAIPMTEIQLEGGPRGDIGGMFREREIRASHIEALYPRAEISETLRRKIDQEADKPIRIVDAIWTDHLADDDAAFHAVFVPDESEPELLVKKRMTGQGCNPYIGFRMGKAAGEIWGRGPAMNTLPAVRTMNLTVELLLQNAAMSLIGMYHMDDDSVVNADTITLEPGAILPRMAGTRGLERIETGGREFNLSQVLLNDQALKIRRGMFNDMLSDPNRTPATAFEVAERMADLAHRMSASFGRLHFELIRPYMMRIIYLGVKRKAIELPTLKGQRLKIDAVSPLALAQGQRDIQNLVQYHQITTALFGAQVAGAQYDEAEMLPYLRERLSVAEKLFVAGPEMSRKIAAFMAAQVAGVQAGGAPAGPVQLNT